MPPSIVTAADGATLIEIAVPLLLIREPENVPDHAAPNCAVPPANVSGLVPPRALVCPSTSTPLPIVVGPS